MEHPSLQDASVRKPENCTAMAEVRAGVDAIDRELVALLAARFGYMRAAARIKPTRDAVRDEERKRIVIEQACAAARVAGVPVDIVAAMWDDLVEASIAYEMAEWDAIRA